MAKYSDITEAKKVIAELKERKRSFEVMEDGKIPEYIELELNSFIPFIN